MPEILPWLLYLLDLPFAMVPLMCEYSLLREGEFFMLSVFHTSLGSSDRAVICYLSYSGFEGEMRV